MRTLLVLVVLSMVVGCGGGDYGPDDPDLPPTHVAPDVPPPATRGPCDVIPRPEACL